MKKQGAFAVVVVFLFAILLVIGLFGFGTPLALFGL